MKPRYDIWQREREQAEDYGVCRILRRKSPRFGKPAVLIWKPKAYKPFINYYFYCPAQREDFIKQTIKDLEDAKQRREERKAQNRITPQKTEGEITK